MPNPLLNVTCPDNYTSAATIDSLYHGNGGTFAVTGQAVLYQVQYSEDGGPGTESWTDEARLNPGAGSIDKGAIGIRFRNAVAGSQAVVSAYINPPNRPGLQVTSSAAASGATNIVPTPLASFPPSSPSDGDLVILELPSTYDPIGGKKLRWLMSYDSANAVWLPVGPGASLLAIVDTGEGSTSAAYGDLATAGPSLTLPRSGDYQIGVNFTAGVQDRHVSGVMSYSIGGGAASDNDGTWGGPPNSDGAGTWTLGSGTKWREKVGLSSGQVVTAKYKVTDLQGSPTGITFGFRILQIVPVRIT